MDGASRGRRRQAAGGYDIRAVEGNEARRQRPRAREPHHRGVHGHARYEAQITLLALSSELPRSNWRRVLIDGKTYDPIPVMDIGERCVAVEGHHDFTGKKIRFE